MRIRSPRRSVSDSACVTVRASMRGATLLRHSPASTVSIFFGNAPVPAARRTVSTAPTAARSLPVTASSGSKVAARATRAERSSLAREVIVTMPGSHPCARQVRERRPNAGAHLLRMSAESRALKERQIPP